MVWLQKLGVVPDNWDPKLNNMGKRWLVNDGASWLYSCKCREIVLRCAAQTYGLYMEGAAVASVNFYGCGAVTRHRYADLAAE